MTLILLILHFLAQLLHHDHPRPAPSSTSRSYVRPAHLAPNPIPDVWRRLVQCEASGDWKYGGPHGHTDPGYDFEGGPNFTHSTWIAYGGGHFALHAYDASPVQQIEVARRVLRAQGVRAWPVCGPRVGLQPGD